MLLKDPEPKTEHFILTPWNCSRVPNRFMFQKLPFKSLRAELQVPESQLQERDLPRWEIKKERTTEGESVWGEHTPP